MEISGDAIRAALPPALAFVADLTRVTQLDLSNLFVLLFVSSATLGSVLAFGTYYFRWELLDQRAISRASEIEATLPRTIAFIYALSRSGMPFPKVLDTLTRNQSVYGEAAGEIGIAVRDMNTFGTDVLTALDRMAQRTPSESLDEFGDNLASVLGSGQSLSAFLHDQYERYQEEAESQQAQYLDLLSTFAEAYVTVLVAGPLFFITILVVIGLVLEDTLPLLRVVVYLGIPLASFGFIVYIDSVTQTIGGRTDDQHHGDDIPLVHVAGITDQPIAETRADGGQLIGDRWQASRERLQAYTDLEQVFAWLRRPGETVLRTPEVTFLVTVPLGLVWAWNRIGAVPYDLFGAMRLVDSPLVEALLFAMATFALVHELNKRRVRAIESVVPDFLDRLASINDAGMSVVESLKRLARSDLDALTPELERTWRDVRWGADVKTAFQRMDRRIESPMVSRATALVTNAIEASGDIGPVLEIAADEARASRRLRRERQQEMLTYLMVIYISFFVFIGIIAALTVSFIPAIESANLGGSTGGLPGGVSAGVFSGIGDVDTAAYTLLFFHAAVIQAICSGLVAGQLGEGGVKDGAKHAVGLLLITMLAFALI